MYAWCQSQYVYKFKAKLQQSKDFCTSADVTSHVGEPTADLPQTKAFLKGENTGRNVKYAFQAWTHFIHVFFFVQCFRLSACLWLWNVKTDQLWPNLHIFHFIFLSDSILPSPPRLSEGKLFCSRRGRAESKPRPLGLTSLTQQWRRQKGAELQRLYRCDLQVCWSTAGVEGRRVDEQNIHRYLGRWVVVGSSCECRGHRSRVRLPGARIQ